MEQHGITIKPRLTQFYQGMTAGEGDHGFEYGGKADLLVSADLGKLGLWKGFSMTVHAEYNFGQSVNGRGGTIAPVNTALFFPGIEGSDRFDLSSVYFGQTFGDSVSLVFGKINVIDLAAGRPFAGGAGIDSFWNIVFAAPPSGTVPPYLFGALLSVRTEPATFGLWIYDPNDVVNRSGFDDPFGDGITFRGSVDFPVTIAGRSGHQGFVALYSTKDGTDLERDPHDTLIPPFPQGFRGQEFSRYYFAYLFDQYLYQDDESQEGFGLFGQFGISDGNPNNPLVSPDRPGRQGDGSRSAERQLGHRLLLRRHQPVHQGRGVARRVAQERAGRGALLDNIALTPGSCWADLQVVRPGLASDTAVIPGLRAVIRL